MDTKSGASRIGVANEFDPKPIPLACTAGAKVYSAMGARRRSILYNTFPVIPNRCVCLFMFGMLLSAPMTVLL